jgi:hypothetical protein
MRQSGSCMLRRVPRATPQANVPDVRSFFVELRITRYSRSALSATTTKPYRKALKKLRGLVARTTLPDRFMEKMCRERSKLT